MTHGSESSSFSGYGSGVIEPDIRICKYDKCRKRIPNSRHANAIFCCTDHGKRQWAKTRAAEDKAKKLAKERFDNPQYQAQKREGEIYKKLDSDRFTLQQLLDGLLTATAYAQQEGVTTSGVTRAVHAHKARIELEKLQGDWHQSWRVRAMLPRELMDTARRMGLAGDTDNEVFEETIDKLVHAYSVFSRYYFNLEGKRPLIKDFHTRWIRSIIVAYCTGGKQLILSPPRVGKSEMLIRFCIWFIVMDPNIRIGWFCLSTDIAKLMLGAVRDILTNHEGLIADVLPPGQLFDPGLKSINPWSAKELKVAQQTHIGAKSSSLLALGRTSAFLSRDMDIIVIDDMEDYDSTREEGQRTYSRNKLAEIGTRKTETACEIYIGSRQHPDDIPNQILQLGDSILQWKISVDSAHDIDCAEDPDDFEAHWDCMLFPEVRSYRYLMEKKLEMETLGLAHLYPLRYLNTAIPAEGQVFDMKLIRDHALDHERGLGLGSPEEGWQLPVGRLVAGLDPSARGIQASFLWHYRDGKMSMVDIETEQSGGQDGAIRIIREWFHKYNLEHWFYETTGIQIDFYNKVKKEVQQGRCHICSEAHPSIAIKDHNTGKNKKDPELGISGMAPRYHDGRISLPVGNNAARRKTNSLLRQLELWTTDGVVNSRKKTDIKMASWFPFPYLIDLEKKTGGATLRLASESSYPGYGDYTEAPWQQTQYPGG